MINWRVGNNKGKIAFLIILSITLLACNPFSQNATNTTLVEVEYDRQNNETTFLHDGQPLNLSIQKASVVRYLVEEELAGQSLPIDAIGVTGEIVGNLSLDAKGNLDSNQSLIKVDLRTLKSDEAKRDNYLKTRTLIGSPQFPHAVFSPKSMEGLSWPIQNGEEFSVRLEGEMTIRGVTKIVSWDLLGHMSDGLINVQAKTEINFSDFAIPKPRLLFILSMDDVIRVEADLIIRPEIMN
jgi:polyisoprenoid-binding protein YceI